MDPANTRHPLQQIKRHCKRWWHSLWLFPVILTLLLFLLTALKLNGSSMGAYSSFFYGPNKKDSNLILNKPRGVRSDEWIVNTQMTIAQRNAGYPHINKNIGNGEDMSVIDDVPYKEWSTIFKPHNLIFLVLPFDNAFAFKWWVMGYLLILSCYFFILTLMPRRRLLAATLSVSFVCSAFVQWWYQYITLAPLYYSLFAGTIFIRLLREKNLLRSALWSILFAYVLVCFFLVLYPPFQIACAIVIAVFSVGYVLQQVPTMPRTIIIQRLCIFVFSGLIAGILALTFLHTRSGVVHTIKNTAYPGKRLQQSGGYDMYHAFSGHLGFQFQFMKKADAYPPNQSETSNFILLLPFLLPIIVFILYRDWRTRKSTDWPLVSMTFTFLILMGWMFSKHFGFLGRVTLLERVPHNRLLIGLGLLNFITVVLVMNRLYKDFKKATPQLFACLFGMVVFLVELGLGFHAMHVYPGFIDIHRVLLFALPVPVIMYCVLRKHILLATIGLLAFSLFTTIGVHPLYRRTDILTKTPLTTTIQDISKSQKGYWIVEVSALENFASMSGASSLSGVYFYPQLALWKSADPKVSQDTYNRYAHVSFVFDRDLSRKTPANIVSLTPDHFTVSTEVCGQFTQKHHVHFIVTKNVLTDSCAHLIRLINYPEQKLLIYRID